MIHNPSVHEMNRDTLCTGSWGKLSVPTEQEIEMPREKRPVPDHAWVKPEDKQMRQLKGKHEGKKNGHAKPAKYNLVEDDDYNPMAGG